MINFEWNFETKIIFGKNAEEKVGQECSRYADRVLIVKGSSNYLEDIGLMNKVRESLRENNIEYYELSGIVPNPTIDKVREGIKICKENSIGLILGVGGGSVIDTAKSIAAGSFYDGDVWDVFLDNSILKDALPVGTIATIAASGSEGSSGAVITNPKANSKFDIIHPLLRPKFSILNPTITLTTPKRQTFCGVVDILAHAMERYFTNTQDVELTDRLGEGLMQTVILNGKLLKENLNNEAARSEMLWASTLAHNGLLDTGRNSCWASHIIATELGARYNAIHGETLSVIFPAWMKYVYKEDIVRFARFANKVFNVEYDITNLEFTAREGIRAIRNFYKELSMPLTLKELGISDKTLFEEMATQATRFGPVGSIKKLNTQDVINIYELAWE